MFAAEVFDKCEVHVDGRVRRGGDIVKVICLGARAVAIGRGFLYARETAQAQLSEPSLKENNSGIDFFE